MKEYLVCEHCGTANEIELLECKNCGADLFGIFPITEEELNAINKTNEEELKKEENVILKNTEISLMIPEEGGIIGREGNIGKEELYNKKYVSNRHIKIEKKEDGYYITDLGSTNGTWINDRKIEKEKAYMINIADKIKLADIEMTVELQ